VSAQNEDAFDVSGAARASNERNSAGIIGIVLFPDEFKGGGEVGQ
jgi:hypothetical protein